MAKNKRRIPRQEMEDKRRHNNMTQINTEQLLSILGGKQVQLEILQAEYEKLSQRMQSTVECPEPSAHSIPAEEVGTAIEGDVSE